MKKIEFKEWLQIIPVWLIMFLFVIGGIHDSSYSKYDLKETYIKEAELKYFQAKANLVDEVNRYIHAKAPQSNLSGLAVVEACEKYGNDLKFVLAQGFVESHYGTAGLAFKTNSVWNVGAYDGLDSNGIHKKFKYNHPNQSIEPYLRLLNENYLVDKIEIDLLSPGKFVNTSGMRYASGEDYETRMLSAYEHVTKDTKIDSLQLEIKYWKLRSGKK